VISTYPIGNLSGLCHRSYSAACAGLAGFRVHHRSASFLPWSVG